jgi:hypothetical protein
VTDTRARRLARRLPPPVARAARRVRGQLARWTAPTLERDLRATRHELTSTKATLRDLRATRRELASTKASLERDLRATRRELASTTASLRKAQEELREARVRLSEAESPLPAELEETIARVREEHLTYLTPPHLRSLAAAVLDVERRGIPGLVVEAGTARGGSAIVMAAAKSPDRPMKVYDVFGMIPPPTEQDGADVHERYRTITEGKARGIGGQVYYGYRDDLKNEVAASFARHGVPVEGHSIELVQGPFEDTIHLDEPVAVAHFDGDWYQSTMTCLERIAPRVVPGGRLILDDYYRWSGCRTAADEYFTGHDEFELRHGAKLHAVRR